jgi:tetrahydromethanopterin S-methyltransferase subunit H
MTLLEFKFQYVEITVMLVYFVLMGLLLFEFRRMKEQIKERMDINNEGLKLKLQALERLTVFAERAGLKNLVGRVESMQMSAAGLHATLIDTIKGEFDYNVSQQIYVSPEVWNAVTRLKDQNIYIINQLAATLPVHANAMDLGKRILEYSMSNNAELNTIVLDALQFEAKKVLG